MARMPIHWIEATAHAHATEDEGRVLQAIDAACPGGPIDRSALEGHFGNPIVRLSRRLDAPGAIRGAWSRWEDAGLLPAIAPGAEARVDEDGVLHIRLDKQAAFQGVLALARDGDAIDVRVRIEAYPSRPEAHRRVVRELLSGGR